MRAADESAYDVLKGFHFVHRIAIQARDLYEFDACAICKRA